MMCHRCSRSLFCASLWHERLTVRAPPTHNEGERRTRKATAGNDAPHNGCSTMPRYPVEPARWAATKACNAEGVAQLLHCVAVCEVRSSSGPSSRGGREPP